MMPTPSHLTTISIIGHTNVGKTSLLRTLLRDSDFGEVKNASATTRHVVAVDILSKDNVPLITLHDTPGLEDATGVMDFFAESYRWPCRWYGTPICVFTSNSS